MGTVAHYLAYKYIMDSWFQLHDTCVNKVGDKINLLYSTSLLIYTPYSKDEILKMSALGLQHD